MNGTAGMEELFERVSPRYDLINRVLSWGRDERWRDRLVAELPPGRRLRLLDLACGSGDVIRRAALRGNTRHHFTGVDLSGGMLTAARAKLAAVLPEERFELITGDAHDLPFADHSFHGVTIAFGWRNTRDRRRVIEEARRVLMRGGRLLILEFSRPRRPGFGRIYTFYLTYILPRLGGLLSGDRAAYTYLRDSILAFPSAAENTALLRRYFPYVISRPLTAGVVTLYTAYRGDDA